MRIAQIVLPDASQYERKSQRVDLAMLSEVVELASAEAAHVYAGKTLPRDLQIEIPYIASAPMPESRWFQRAPKAPRKVVTPPELPEAVEDMYFLGVREQSSRPKGGGSAAALLGTYARPSIRNAIEQSYSRITRFRGDVEWRLFERVPTPEDLATVDLWVDPAVDETDLDGFVAEALVVGLPVVASRTAINTHRLEQGRTGFLVPVNDPNELTHAILTALFKPEVSGAKQNAARQTISKFRGRQRLRVLAQIYETLK